MKKLILLTAFLAINAFALPRTTSPGMIMTGASGVIKAGVGGVLEGSSTTSDLPEGSNKYYTDSRAQAANASSIATKEPNISSGTTLQYWRGDKTFQTLNSSVVPESGNLYWTTARGDARITIQKAQPNGLASLDSGGKIPTDQLPALAITNTFVVANQTAMLALDAQEGDVALRTDNSKTYILSSSSPSTLADWKEILTPASPVL